MNCDAHMGSGENLSGINKPCTSSKNYNVQLFDVFMKPEKLVCDGLTNGLTNGHFYGANPYSKNLGIFFIRVKCDCSIIRYLGFL